MPDSYGDFSSTDQRHHTERSTFYKVAIGIPIVRESKLGYFQMVPPLGTRVFESFFVTRGHMKQPLHFDECFRREKAFGEREATFSNCVLMLQGKCREYSLGLRFYFET